MKTETAPRPDMPSYGDLQAAFCSLAKSYAELHNTVMVGDLISAQAVFIQDNRSGDAKHWLETLDQLMGPSK